MQTAIFSYLSQIGVATLAFPGGNGWARLEEERKAGNMPAVAPAGMIEKLNIIFFFQNLVK